MPHQHRARPVGAQPHRRRSPASGRLPRPASLRPAGSSSCPQCAAAGQVPKLQPEGAAGDGDVFGVRPEDGRAYPAAPGGVQGGEPVPAMPQPRRAGADGLQAVPEGGDAATAGESGTGDTLARMLSWFPDEPACC